ncbi:alpha/beta hydrolase [Nonomuraea sp. NPDC046570]|uniref:alpha/beta fold hydrolase n=1 Tax=Nonomuraea sp. NPDC046570 TaxID=3155255 RepID=UPI0033E74C0C
MADTSVFGAPGRVTLPDGRRLYHVSQGEGEPVVVLEAGLGGSRADWGLVLAGIATSTKVVAYDRAGLGRSDPDTARRDVGRMAEDLGHLLDGLGAERYLLVGHSLGGPIIRAYAARHPARVAGLVLIDPADETLDMYYSLKHRLLVRGICLAMELLSRAGYRKLPGGSRAAELFPPEMRAEAEPELTSPGSLRASRAEATALADGLRELRAAPGTLPPVPVTVISGALSRSRGEAARHDDLVAAHRAFAESLPHGRHVMAERSGHMIQQDQPNIVIEEILRLLP